MFGPLIGTMPKGSPNPTISPSPTFKDQENYVYKLLESTDPGVLALIYKSLYARGYRISSVEPEIRKMKKRLAAPSS